MKCPNCENSIDDNAVVCEWCGVNVHTFEAEQAAEEERIVQEELAKQKACEQKQAEEEARKKAAENDAKRLVELEKQKVHERALETNREENMKAETVVQTVTAKSAKVSRGNKLDKKILWIWICIIILTLYVLLYQVLYYW